MNVDHLFDQLVLIDSGLNYSVLAHLYLGLVLPDEGCVDEGQGFEYLRLAFFVVMEGDVEDLLL